MMMDDDDDKRKLNISKKQILSHILSQTSQRERERELMVVVMVVRLLLALFSPCHSVQLIQPCHSHKYIDGHQVVVYLKEKREKRERKRVWQLISCRRLQKNEKKKKLEREREREREREVECECYTQ